MVDDKTFFFIVNPSAGGGQVRAIWPTIEERLKREGFVYEVRQTQRAREATGLVRQAREAGYRHFIAVGGDGTNHEIINGLFDSQNRIHEEVTLGFFPAGSGNDFLRFLRVPADIDDGFRRLREPDLFAVDIGNMRFMQGETKVQEYFISVAGTGFTADVTKTANDHFKFMGRFCYIGAFFPRIMTCRNVDLDITIDGTAFTRKSCMTVVANTAYFGGGMKIAPESSITDGMFDVLLFREFGRLELIANFPKVFKGTHTSHQKVEVFRGSHVTIRSAEPQYLLADGEIIGETPVEFTLLPRVLSIRR